MGGHSDRVGCLDWNQHILASGGREGDILLHDVRVAEHQVGGGNVQWNMNSLCYARLTASCNR